MVTKASAEICLHTAASSNEIEYGVPANNQLSSGTTTTIIATVPTAHVRAGHIVFATTKLSGR